MHIIKQKKEVAPYLVAETMLRGAPIEQANLVWSTVQDLASEAVKEAEVDLAKAVVHLGMQSIPVRDFVIANIALLDDETGKEYLLAMSGLTGAAPSDLKPHVAAATAMLAAGYGFDREVVETFLERAEGTSLAQLIRNGLEMRAPARLFRLSAAECLDSVVTQLRDASH